MKITFFGLAITSSWGNGHATTYRSLCNALARRGHEVVFFEHDAEWYANNRDIDGLPDITIARYQDWPYIRNLARAELRDSDVAVVGSYFPHARQAMDDIFDSPVAVKAFYDIDTPITLSQLRENGRTDYVSADDIPNFDLYFSFTGGPALPELEQSFGARRAVALYCSVETENYFPLAFHPHFQCEISYMGTYAPDRQPKLHEMLCGPAHQLSQNKFIVAGPQYPAALDWPANVRRIEHLEPKYHPHLYSSSRLVLNLTRRDMMMVGYSPSVRLFEAAACGAAIISDVWPGLDEFFSPGQQILFASSGNEVLQYLRNFDDEELRRIGRSARERILAEHSSVIRARQFEDYVSSAIAPRTQYSAIAR